MPVRSLLTAALLSTCVVGGAMAADLPMRSPPPAPFYPAPVFTWTGFYAGVNAGYVFDSSTRFRTTDLVVPGVAETLGRVNDDGFTGGGQIGYNYQFGAGNGFVVGVEADAAYTDLDRTQGIDYTGFARAPGAGGTALGTLGVNYRGELDYLGTVRGRVGYAFNQFLIYGTGGFAYGSVNNSVNAFTPAGVLFASGGNSSIATGYAYGGGIEYALPTNTFLNFFHSSAVTLKAEYLHYDLGSTNIVVGTGPVAQYNTRVHNDGDLARVGINYKF